MINEIKLIKTIKVKTAGMNYMKIYRIKLASYDSHFSENLPKVSRKTTNTKLITCK